MRLSIDIELFDVSYNIDINQLAAYLNAVITEQTGNKTAVQVLDIDYVNPIKLAKALHIKPNMPGGF